MPSKDPRIQKVFVLMLENRSFDHLLGFSQLKGYDIQGNSVMVEGLLDTFGNQKGYSNINSANLSHPPYPASVGAPDPLDSSDPPHEFNDVLLQLCGKNPASNIPSTYPHINNSGFIDSYATQETHAPECIMQGFDPTHVPVLTTLAQEFAICDHWFSSMPGSTWPNRFFVHAASSAGLDDSPDKLPTGEMYAQGQAFHNGTVFDRLNQHGLPWQIFAGDYLPQSFALKGMTHEWLLHARIKLFSSFAQAITAPDYAPMYTFIEPAWGNLFGKSMFAGGNSQHPLDGIAGGEKLISDVYQAIRQSPHWEHSLIIITYDEHGGFYDHCQPPSAKSPNDGPAIAPAVSKHGFDFSQLGVRVPAVIISPWIRKQTIDSRIYDHSSIPATLAYLWGLNYLTERDKAANTLDSLLTLPQARISDKDAPLSVPYDPMHYIQNTISASSPNTISPNDMKPDTPIHPATRGFLNIAHRKHQAITCHQQDTSQFIATLKNPNSKNYARFSALLSPPLRQAKRRVATQFEDIHTEHSAREYIQQVMEISTQHQKDFPELYH